MKISMCYSVITRTAVNKSLRLSQYLSTEANKIYFYYIN